ncbi:tRNA methyltransferase 10 homolog C [Syngnathoides biaculeatus]|uniref:tRNA methyltransferase 10 homolog C n=1 Tax=Syngnathoides biaculeatus TaxID=300417 RepID=UPI002ADD35F8|nr:tRNA methyltransferase 10 homolog C [Syngnathoides biaculeatus]
MLQRFFTPRHLNGLWKSSSFVLSRVNKTQAVWVLPGLYTCHSSRLFSTGYPQKKENVDLDKWKSVMRSQSSSTEQEDNDDVAASDEDEIPEGNSLETVRELVAMWRLAGRLVPQEISDDQLKTLADLTTKSARKKYLKFLALKEGHKRVRKEKQQQKKAAREAFLEQKRAQDGDKKELKNSFIPQFWNRNLDRVLAWRSIQAMLFDQPLVFDMSYESNMSRREIENTVTQLMEVEGWNRRANEPYHLHFCNLQPHGAYMKEFLNRYGAETWDRLLITSTEGQAVDLFPRDRLVYLTADSPNVLRTFDHSKVYIIGALVDRSILSGLSLGHAKRLKLATARLPLDEFLHWEMGAKNLTLDQMIRIMITIKETGKWEEALKFVPKRKHVGFFHQREQQITNDGSGENGDKSSKSIGPVSKKSVRSWDQNAYKPRRGPGFTGLSQMSGPPRNRENKPAATRVRGSLNSSMEGRLERKSRVWWDD